MRKLIFVLFALVMIITGASAYLIYNYLPFDIIGTATGVKKVNSMDAEFTVYQNGNFIGGFNNRDDAVDFAMQFSQTYVEQKGKAHWVWNNYPQFSVYYNDEEYLFKTFSEARQFAFSRVQDGARVVNRANQAVIWDTSDRLPPAYMIEGVPLINQNPELPRGCEVTSIAMMLNHYGIGISKMDLAEQIRKDETPYSKDKNGRITFGDPHRGFVGNMYDKSEPGLGVYHEPVCDLLKDYIGNDALDLTGAPFSDLFYFIAKDKPVFVITNATFKPLTEDKFQVWSTSEGENIVVTNYEHAVLIKGYDNNFVYFNNPLDDSGVQNAPLGEFISAWEQMGMQAVTYFE